MGFVPQTHNIFTTMTVEENLEMGAFIRRDEIKDTMAQVYDLFPIPEAETLSMGGRAFGRPTPAGRSGPSPDDAAEGADAG